MATALGLRVRPAEAGWFVVDRKLGEVYSGPWLFRGTALDELARLGHELIGSGTVTLT